MASCWLSKTNVNKCSGILLYNLYLTYPAIGAYNEQTRRTYAATILGQFNTDSRASSGTIYDNSTIGKNLMGSFTVAK